MEMLMSTSEFPQYTPLNSRLCNQSHCRISTWW